MRHCERLSSGPPQQGPPWGVALQVGWALGGSPWQRDEMAEVRHSTYQDGRWLNNLSEQRQWHETSSRSRTGSCSRLRSDFLWPCWPLISALCLQTYLIMDITDVQVTLYEMLGQYWAVTQDLAEILLVLFTVMLYVKRRRTDGETTNASFAHFHLALPFLFFFYCVLRLTHM